MAGGFQSYSTTPGSNTSINGINIAEGCPPSGVNDALRQLAADGTSLWQTTPTWMGTTGGSANAYTLTPTVALAAYTTGQAFRALSNFANTPSATLNISALGAKNIVRFDNSALVANDIPSGALFDTVYDGTSFRLLGPTAASVTAFKNVLMNGNFAIWQRGTSFSSPANGAYVADRWQVSYDGTGAFSIGKGDFGAAGSLVRNYFNWNQSGALAGAATRAFVQKIESVNTLSGQTATLSFSASCTSGTVSVTPNLSQVFGTGGSPSATVVTAGTAATVTTTGTRFSQSISIPSIGAKTLGSTLGTDYLQLALLLPTTGTYNVSFWDIQLELGSVPTPFERTDYALQTMQCSRFYTTRAITITAYCSTTLLGSVFHQGFSVPVPMRATPTIVVNGTASTNVSAASISMHADNYGFDLACTVSNANPYYSYTANPTFTADL